MSFKNPNLLMIEIALNVQNRSSTYHAQHSVQPIPGKLRRGHGRWESARFQAVYVAWSWSRLIALSRPAQQRVTPAVGQP